MSRTVISSTLILTKSVSYPTWITKCITVLLFPTSLRIYIPSLSCISITRTASRYGATRTLVGALRTLLIEYTRTTRMSSKSKCRTTTTFWKLTKTGHLHSECRNVSAFETILFSTRTKLSQFEKTNTKPTSMLSDTFTIRMF